MGQLRGEADLADAGDDLVEPGGGLGGLGRGLVVGLVLEDLRGDPESGPAARRAGGGREELELQRGQSPAADLKRPGQSVGASGMAREESSSSYCQSYSRKQHHDWVTRIGFGASMGGWLTALLWLILRSAYVGVFVVGFCLGLYLLENWQLQEALQEESMRVTELEKQVVSMRATVNEMSLMVSEMEAEQWRRYERARQGRGGSSHSL